MSLRPMCTEAAAKSLVELYNAMIKFVTNKIILWKLEQMPSII